MKKEKQIEKEPECVTVRITYSLRKKLNIMKIEQEKTLSEVIEGLLKK